MSTTFANSINSNPIYADRAEKDAAGNTIATTYATKSELPEGVPSVTSADDGKVLKASYSGGTGSFSWQTESGGGAQASWTEDDPSDPSYIQNKPAIVGIAAGSNVSITEANNTLTIAATDTTYTAGTGISITNGAIANSDPLPAHTSTEASKVLGVDSNGDLEWVAQSGGSSYSAGTGIDITSGTISVDTATVAMKTDIPTVPTTDQTYNSSSTNPQSGTAVAGAISGVAQVPSVTSSDNAKVLTASYSGGVASYSWQTAQGGGGGGTSNVTTADKQINVAVNGTGLPMQLNLLSPKTNYTTLNLGHPTVSVQYTTDYGESYYAPVLEWTFSRSAIQPPDPMDSNPSYTLPLTLDIANDLVLFPASDRTWDSTLGWAFPKVGGYAILINTADSSRLAGRGTEEYLITNNEANPPRDCGFVQGTYNLGIETLKAGYLAASTLKLRIEMQIVTSLDTTTWESTYISQADAEALAAMISQHASDFTLTAVSSTATDYTSYIGSTSISGQTTTADSSYSGLYRYDFTAEQTASLVPGTYLVQVNGPSGSGNQTTYAYLFKDGDTGYSYYKFASKTSYLSSSGTRVEMFLMNVDANTTAIGTKVSYGNFTMVRLA